MTNFTDWLDGFTPPTVKTEDRHTDVEKIDVVDGAENEQGVSTTALGVNSESDDVLFTSLISRLTWIQQDAEESWHRICGRLANVHPANMPSAHNLVHYLALRRHDIRDLQSQLARNGMSSLGRSESHVMSNLNKVLRLLYRIVNRPYEPLNECETALSLDEGTEILLRRTHDLLGPKPKHRRVRIMVTLPAEAADNYELVRNLVAGGMDCARINCAHDGPEVWERMVRNISNAKKETGRDCKICFDIAGPKLRTGSFEAGPEVLKLRPVRDMFGHVLMPAQVWLTQSESPVQSPDAASDQITLPEDFIRCLSVGDRIRFRDTRGASRHLNVMSETSGGFWLETRKTSYIGPHTVFKATQTTDDETLIKTATAASIAAVEQSARLRVGDILILTRSQVPGKAARVGRDGKILSPTRISCKLPEVFDDVRVGQKIWLDDGKLGGIITSVANDEIHVEINHSGPKGHLLRHDKGINLPESELCLPALTDADRENLTFIVKHADLVGYSFVRTAADVRALQEHLKNIGGSHLGIVLKIETLAAFENLPEILLASMETPVIGVMIARGDLAVECGFERLAEVQEEIMWICEAAHMPVIWATQVLEQLSKKGVYSRAEITDAAMSERAECVMLNKGPYILEAVQTLDNVLRRMQSHQDKKRSMMRPLKLAKRFFAKESKRAESS